MSIQNKKIFIAGEFGFVGKNVKTCLHKNGLNNILSTPKDLNFRDPVQTEQFISKSKPDIVILAAGRVGGILANKKFPAEFLYDNLMIWSNIIHCASDNEVKKLIFLGSATVYPEDSPVPFKEEYLLSGKLDKNTEPYAVAKIAAIKLCETFYTQFNRNFFTLTLANLYGLHDHFESEDSHVVPALISKIFNAKKQNLTEVELWGSGNPTRDLLFADDLADAILFALENIEADMIYKQGISHLNVGTGIENSIKNLAETIANHIGYKGKIKFDKTKPDGTVRKFVDTTRINKLGWKAKTSLEEGIKKTCEYYISSKL